MAQATLTSKGQITIPKNIRESLQIQVGDKIEFTITSNNEALLRPITKAVDEVFGKLHRPGRRPVSVEKMDSKIKQKVRASFK